VVEELGVQTWQAFAGFLAPEGNAVPPMKQPAPQVVPVQISPAPQLDPSGAVDQAVVDLGGTQTWHALAGFVAFGA
jgi:hypothetical protein